MDDWATPPTFRMCGCGKRKPKHGSAAGPVRESHRAQVEGRAWIQKPADSSPGFFHIAGGPGRPKDPASLPPPGPNQAPMPLPASGSHAEKDGMKEATKQRSNEGICLSPLPPAASVTGSLPSHLTDPITADWQNTARCVCAAAASGARQGRGGAGGAGVILSTFRRVPVVWVASSNPSRVRPGGSRLSRALHQASDEGATSRFRFGASRARAAKRNMAVQ